MRAIKINYDVRNRARVFTTWIYLILPFCAGHRNYTSVRDKRRKFSARSRLLLRKILGTKHYNEKEIGQNG